MRINIDEIGGGKVVRGFTAGTEYLHVGAALTADFIKSIPAANRNTLIDKNFIQVWPKAVAVSPPVAVAGRTAERYTVPLGFGRYDVVSGFKINDAPLTKAEADKLAGKPEAKSKRK